MFKPINYDKGRVLTLLLGNAETITKFQLVKYSSGYIVDAAAGDSEVEYIALETVTDGTASDGGTTVDCLPICSGIKVEALTVTTPTQADDVGNSYDLAGANTLDLTATDDNVFHIDKLKNANDKLVIGSFNKPAII